MTKESKEIIKEILKAQLAIETARLKGARQRHGSFSDISVVCMNEGTESAIEAIKSLIKSVK